MATDFESCLTPLNENGTVMMENYKRRKVGIATVCSTTMHFPREISMPSMQALLISVEKQANTSLSKLRVGVSTAQGIAPSTVPGLNGTSFRLDLVCAFVTH
jgi:hypothetical protein